MRLFITGISGLLGLNAALAARDRFEVSGCFLSHPVAAEGIRAYQTDVRAVDAVAEALEPARPDVVIHTVGMSNVDACEVDPGLALDVNVSAARSVAEVTRALDARLVHISTDHLFDGQGSWKTEIDPLAPLNTYAKTKGEAEQVVLEAHPDALVIRTNFYGWGTSVRTSFSDWIIRALAQGTELTMFNDVFFTPILVNDLIEAIFALLAQEATGLFHLAGGERLSKYDFAVRMAETFGRPTARVRSVSATAVPLRARRPADMSLSCAKAEALLGRKMPSAITGLQRLKELERCGWPRVLQRAIDAGRG